ncbi:MAG: iron-containing alcohol dehydrogenase family protein [Treponema sp.]|nr:iron-containing alcohol dehydrogenase family protein [Treponema sp.]
MFTIKTPYWYINEVGAIEKAGEYLAKIGKNPLIIAGKSAFSAVEKQLLSTLNANGISSDSVSIFSGYPSQRQFDTYAQDALEIGADFIIGIGGGRVLDTAKATADTVHLPVVTIPTVAATCAAWAALTIQYDDNGSYVKHRPNPNAPRLVIADPKIIFTAPKRYLFSGVVDTFAKFYEERPTFEQHPEHIPAAISLNAAQIAFDRLKKETSLALSEAEKGVFGQAARDVVDSIIYIAGFAGSFKTEYGHYSFAHPFYHTSTKLRHTNHKLHGEKVAFGITAQLVLEGKTDAEITDTIKLFDSFDTAFTLDDFEITENRESDLAFLGKQIPEDFPYVKHTAEEIKHALLYADELSRAYKAGNK